MKCKAPLIASSFDFNSKTAYPPTTSLASVKGPSTVVSCPREIRTRVLIDVGASPPLAIIVPFLFASSLSFAMASMSSLGGGPEFFSDDLTSIINRIVPPLLCVFVFRFGAGFPVRLRPGLQSWLYCNVERGPAKSTGPRRDSRGCKRPRVEGTAISVLLPRRRRCFGRLRIPVEAHTHHHRLPGGNSWSFRWPLPSSLPGGWRSRRSLPWPR